MLNCLGRTNYQYHPVSKPKSERPAKSASSCKPQLPSLELKELVVDMPEGQEPNKEELSRVPLIKSKASKSLHLIENVRISINARIGVSIGKCDVATLSALIREMEVNR
jgi:hypothetical protein